MGRVIGISKLRTIEHVLHATGMSHLLRHWWQRLHQVSECRTAAKGLSLIKIPPVQRSKHEKVHSGKFGGILNHRHYQALCPLRP